MKVGINKANNKKYSLLVISFKGLILLESVPKDILLNKNIEKQAERKIPDAPNAATQGFFCQIPIKASCSLTQLMLKGIPQLHKVKIKKRIVNTGIYVTNPLI